MPSKSHALVLVPSVVVLLACAGAAPKPPPVTAPVSSAPAAPPVRHAEGDACPGQKAVECVDAASALICQHDVFTRIPCRGPEGCHGAGAESTCDDDVMEEGDACAEDDAVDNYGCSADHQKENICDHGVARTDRTCRGPKHCAIEGIVIRCDDSLGDVGEPCTPDDNDSNYACSVDRTTEVVCDPGTKRFTLSNTCHGPEHCHIDDNKVFCDQSTAREGDVCRPVANHSCTDDGAGELQCSAQGTWVKQRDCRPAPCFVRDREVYCSDAKAPKAPSPRSGKKPGAGRP